MKIVRFMKNYVFKHKFKMIWFILLNLVLWALSMLIPYVTGNYIDNLIVSFGENSTSSSTPMVDEYTLNITSSFDENLIWRTIVILSVIWTLQLILSYIRNILNVRLNSLEYAAVDLTV